MSVRRERPPSRPARRSRRRVPRWAGLHDRSPRRAGARQRGRPLPHAPRTGAARPRGGGDRRPHLPGPPARDARWPFRRSLHAAMVDRLRRAGARGSSTTSPGSPAPPTARTWRCYGSLARAGGGVLATSGRRPRATPTCSAATRTSRIHTRAGAATCATTSARWLVSRPLRDGRLKTLAVAAVARHRRARRRSGFDSGGTSIDYRGTPGTSPPTPLRRLSRTRAIVGFRGRIVVVGASAPTLQDVHAAPTSGRELIAGPEIPADADLDRAPRRSGRLRPPLTGAHRPARPGGAAGAPAPSGDRAWSQRWGRACSTPWPSSWPSTPARCWPWCRRCWPWRWGPAAWRSPPPLRGP